MSVAFLIVDQSGRPTDSRLNIGNLLYRIIRQTHKRDVNNSNVLFGFFSHQYEAL